MKYFLQTKGCMKIIDEYINEISSLVYWHLMLLFLLNSTSSKFSESKLKDKFLLKMKINDMLLRKAP